MHIFMIQTVVGIVVRVFADDRREAVSVAMANGDIPVEVTQIA